MEQETDEPMVLTLLSEQVECLNSNLVSFGESRYHPEMTPELFEKVRSMALGNINTVRKTLKEIESQVKIVRFPG